jgi:cyanophycinase
MVAFLVLIAALMEGPFVERVWLESPLGEGSGFASSDPTVGTSTFNRPFNRPGDGPAFTSLAPAGTLVIVGGANTPAEADSAFLAAAKSGNNHLILIPTAAVASDKEALSSFAKAFEGKVGKVTVLHAKDRSQALAPDFAKGIAEASAVWIGGGDQKRLAERYANTPVETELKALLARGGAVGGTSAGAAILSQTMIAGGNPHPEIQNGLGLVRGLVIDQHFSERNRAPRLKTAIGKHPDQVGLGIDESTAVILKGRDLRVVGKGKATWMVAGVAQGNSGQNPIREKVLPAGTRDDLVRLFRETFVAKETKPRGKPAITKGSVMAVGGGGMGPDLAKKFVELAGGANALIVILPTAAPEDSPVLQGLQAQRMLGRGGATNFKVLSGTNREEVESKEYLERRAAICRKAG